MSSRKLRQGLWLSESTRTWHFEIKVQGEKKKGDTGCAQLALAREWLKAYRQQLALGRVGLAQVPAKPPLTLRKAHESWEAFAAGRLSPSWRATVGRSLRLHFAPFMDRPLTALTSEEVQAMVTAYLQEDGHSKGGANVLLRALSSVVSHAITLDPSLQRPYRVKLAKVQEKPRAPLDAKRLGALVATLEALDAPAQVLAMARLMAGLGLRVGEARRARVEAVNLKAKTFTPWDPEAGTKGKEAVELPIPAWLLPHIRRMVGDRTEGYLIPGARAAVPSKVLFWQWTVKARTRLRWPWLTPHEIRGAYATLLSEQGVPAQTIQRLLRHKSIKTTMRYLRADHAHAREALARIGRAAGL